MFVYSLKAICYSLLISYKFDMLSWKLKVEILKTIKLHFIDLLRDIHSPLTALSILFACLDDYDEDDCQMRIKKLTRGRICLKNLKIIL